MKPLEPLKSILSEQENCCRTLVGLLQKERKHLVEFDADGMEETMKEKDTHLLRLRLLEEERIRLTAALWPREAGAPAGDVTLRSLAERTGDPELAGIRLKLVSLVQTIEDLNAFNRHLIDRSLGSIRPAAGFFRTFGGPETGRDAGGTMISRRT